MAKITYVVKGLEGKAFERTTEKAYTHAVVDYKKDGKKLVASGTWSFHSSMALAEKQMNNYLKNYNIKEGTVLKVVAVVEKKKPVKKAPKKAAPKKVAPKATGNVDKTIDLKKVPKDTLATAKAMAKAFGVPLKQMLTAQVTP